MWLMSTRGFYSVVEHRDDPDRLLVRARCKADIDALADLVPGEPVRLENADYAWRLEVSREAWAEAVQMLVAEIVYPNFKSAVRDPAHHDAYMGVWQVMRALDDRR